MKKIAVLFSIVIFFNALSSSCLTVYASNITQKEIDNMTDDEIQSAMTIWLPAWIYRGIGLVIQPGKFSVQEFFTWWQELLDARENINNSESVEDFIRRTAKYNENGGIDLSDEMVDSLYQISNYYIEEYTGWYEAETIDYKQYPASKFDTQGLYNSFLSYCRQNLKGTDNILLVGGIMGHSRYDENNNHYVVLSQSVTKSLEDVEFYLKQKYSDGFDAYMTQEWETIMPAWGYLYDDGTYEPEVPSAGIVDYVRFWANDIYNRRPLTDGVRIVRVYKTMEDLKSYSVGQRPYFTTSKFQDYDVNGDNSCIISESELNGSSVYGDVINYIIEYPDADGLTEDELRRILDEYFDKLPDGGSDGGDSGGGFGDGLGGFLDGIGAIGDAILGILGKLLEYIGKAIELLSDTVLKVVDLIPKNITALISGLFPFLPQEWLTAIELSLVLAVIVGIVGIFKK